MSRAVVFKMRRKLKDETAERLRHAAPGTFDTLRAKLARFALDARDAVRAARPELPDALGDRDQDNWSTLLAVAKQAGGEWVRQATAAALELTGKAEGSQSAGNELLADIQAVFERKRVDRITSADLLAALVEDEEAPWATWNKGKPINTRQLARLLSPYEVRSRDLRFGYDGVKKGFDLEGFREVFARFLSPRENAATSATFPESPITARVSVLPDTSDVAQHGATPLRINTQRCGNDSESATRRPSPLLDCCGVADKTAIFGGAERTLPEDADFDDAEVF